MPRFLNLLSGVFALILFTSCQTPLKPSGFLGKDDAKLAQKKLLPFSRSWKNPEADLSKYSRVAIKPMRTDGLRKLGKIAGKNVRNMGDTAMKDAKKLATHGTEKFRMELDRSPNRDASISESPARSKGLMVLETNLVQVEPGRPVAQVANLIVPFIGLANRPSIGIEGRFVDAVTGKTLFAFSDLERSEISLLDLKKFSYYGVQERELNRWAEQVRKVVDGNGNTLVRDAFLIQPLNW